MIFLPCLLVNHGFSSRRHLAYERMGRSLILPVYTKRHMRSPVVVPLHKQIHGITLAHHDCLKLWQLALNLAVQPLQLAVGLRVSDACQNLFYSKLDQFFLKDRCPLLLYLRGVGVNWDPLSVIMDAGLPWFFMASSSTASAFSVVACSNMPYPVTKRERRPHSTRTIYRHRGACSLCATWSSNRCAQSVSIYASCSFSDALMQGPRLSISDVSCCKGYLFRYCP